MRKRVYYGSFQNQRRRSRRKSIIIVMAMIIGVGAIVWFTVFWGAAGRSDVKDLMKGSIQEITQLKLQLEEKDDEITSLKEKIAYYEAELAARPTPSPTPIPAPNEEVLSGQPTPTPTPRAAKTPRPTAKPTPTQETGTGETSMPNEPEVHEPASDVVQPEE